MTVDLSDWRFWLALAQTVAIVVLWLRKPGEQAGEAIVELKGRMAVMDERMRHIPTVEQLEQVRGALSTVSAQLEGLDEDVKSTRSAVNRIEDWMRNNK